MAVTNKKSSKLKEPVRVRTKKLADGSESYYLDIYVNGKRSYEFLKMYHLPEVNARVREQNRATREAVETIKVAAHHRDYKFQSRNQEQVRMAETDVGGLAGKILFQPGAQGYQAYRQIEKHYKGHQPIRQKYPDGRH